MMINFNNITKSINEKGFHLCENFLKVEDIENLKKLLFYKAEKGSEAAVISFNKKKYLIDLLKLDFKNIILKRYIKKLINIYKLYNIAINILGENIELYNIDHYTSKKNSGMIIPWHTDQAYSGRREVKNFLNPDRAALKFFFYLSNVESNNGCLGYIPSSNKITYILKKLIYEKQIKYSPYWKLSDLRNLIQEKNINFILQKYISNEEIENFLVNSSFSETHKKDTNEFDISSKEGSLLIFDEAGVHRGASLEKTDRLCLRFFFRKLS